MNFDYGNVLTRSLKITWKYKSFWLFSMLPLLIGMVMFFVSISPVFLVEEGNNMAGLAIAVWGFIVLVGGLVGLLLGTSGSTSLMLGMIRAEQGETSTSFMELMRDGFAYFGRALGALLIIQMTVGLAISAFFLLVALLTFVTMGLASICLQPVMLLLTPLSFLIIAVMNGSLIAIIQEDLGSWEAVKRALRVVYQHVWKFMLLALIVYFGSTILSTIMVLPVTIPIMAIPFAMENTASEQVILISVAVFSCLFFPLMLLLSGVTGTLMNAVFGLSYLRLTKPNASEVFFASDLPQNATP